jgi:transposase-like protein
MVSQSDADTSSHTTGRTSSSKARVQIVERVSGRRNSTVERKLAIIGEAFASGSSVASTIERHEISRGQLYTGVGNCLAVNLAEFATAVCISKTDWDLRGSNLRQRAKRPRCHQR